MGCGAGKRVALAGGLWLAVMAGCERYESLRVVPEGSMRVHYLLDYECRFDPVTRFATMAHLVVFNPGRRQVDLQVTAYFEDREPRSFALLARPGTSTSWNCTDMPIEPNSRFALRVESSEPVFAQATLGWNDVANEAGWEARSASGARPREAAKSYTSIPALAPRWYVADGTVIARPGSGWVRESEWALVLNPRDRPARVELTLFYSVFARTHTVDVPARRLRAVSVDTFAIANHHYGARFVADQPVAVQWLRTLHWYDAPELMAFWSVPGVPFAADVETPFRLD